MMRCLENLARKWKHRKEARWCTSNSRDVASLLRWDDIARMTRSQLEIVARRSCYHAYLGNHQALCRVLGRYHMFVDTRDMGVAPHMLMDGYWESWITVAIARHLSPGMRVIDVGANLGYYTLLSADAVGETGQVFAVEPIPDLVKLVHQSVEMNGFGERVQIVQAVASDHADATITLNVLTQNYGSSSIATASELEQRFAGNPGPLEALTCDTITLDSVVGSDARINLIKLDAEGAEPLVWAGMRRILDHSPNLVVVMEYCQDHLDDSDALLTTIENEGFTLGEIRPNGAVKSITKEQLIARSDFTMLWLARRT